MKITARTFLPFDNTRSDTGDPQLSPLTDRSVIPVNNVQTIRDIAIDHKPYRQPKSRGNWAEGDDESTSYKETGDDYKRQEQDMAILNDFLPRDMFINEQWKVKIPACDGVPGGSKTFVSFELAQRYMDKCKKDGIPTAYLTRVAQKTEETSRIQVVAKSMEKTFMVESTDLAEGVVEKGSAFCVSPHVFLTCAHVIKNYNKNEAFDISSFSQPKIKLVKNGKYYNANLIAVDPTWDIALIDCDVNCDTFKIEEEMYIGEDIFTIGSPHGYEDTVSVGTLGSMQRNLFLYDGAPEYMFVDLSVMSGNSGGPVIKESDGSVVGMITLVISDQGEFGLNAALPAGYIKEFLGRHF